MKGAVWLNARSSSSRIYKPVDTSTWPLWRGRYEPGRSCGIGFLPVARVRKIAPDARGPAQINTAAATARPRNTTIASDTERRTRGFTGTPATGTVIDAFDRCPLTVANVSRHRDRVRNG